MSALPEAVQRYLQREAIAPAPTAVLSFDGDWQLLSRSGELAAFGIADVEDELLQRRFKELCMGQSRLGGTRLSQLDLGGGHNADVHLVAEQNQVHVVLIDVRGGVEREREWQQNAQDAKLRSYEQGKQLREARQQRINLEQARDEAKAKAAELVACNQLYDQRLRGGLAELERAAEALLQLPVEHAGRGRHVELLKQAVDRVDRMRAALARAVSRIDEHRDSGSSKMAMDELSAELYASVAAQVEARGVGFSLRLQQRSAEPLRGIAGAASETFHYGLWLTLLRSRGEVEGVLRWDGQFAQLQLISDADDFDLRQAELLWEHRLPAVADEPLAYALFGLGRCAHRYRGRVLEQRDSKGRHRLLISLAGRQDEPSGEITSPGFRGPVGIISGDRDYAEEWIAQLGARGITLHNFGSEPQVLQELYEDAPPALLFDLHSAPEGRSMAYKLRARGYPGQLLALGDDDNPLSGSMASTWSAALPRDCSTRQLLRTLSGRSGA